MLRTQLALILLAGSLGVALAHSQAPSPAAPPVTAMVPMAPAGVVYRYWPMQIIQWVGPELPCSMVELDVDARGAQPLYDAVLVDRTTGKRVHYTNQPGELALDKAAGADAFLVPMQFDAPAEPANGGTYLLRFVTEAHTPVSWQFVQGSDVSEQGSGVTPIGGPVPALLYREQGAVAGEGTTLKVGDKASTAELWKEISQPPYFIAYRGALSQGVHVLAWAPGTVSWTVEPSTGGADGGSWTLKSAQRSSLAAHVETGSGTGTTVRESSEALGTAVLLEARGDGSAGWLLQRAQFGPAGGKADHTVSIQFNPPLGSIGASSFVVVAGRKKHLAAGTATASEGGAVSWSFSDPATLPREPVQAIATQSR